MITIVSAHSGAALEHVITLSQEYTTWMLTEIQVHYPELDIKEFMSEHDYDDLRKKFPGEHMPPSGGLFIALDNDDVCGCVGLGRLTETVCEMRTLYVRPTYRGRGVAKKLAEAVLNEARTFGYQVMRLDTLAFMTGAQTLYHSLGFYDIDAYRDLSPSLKQYICFLEFDLTQREQ